MPVPKDAVGSVPRLSFIFCNLFPGRNPRDSDHSPSGRLKNSRLMNIIQTVPRIDCKAFAKCGKKSLAHCRRYKRTDEECAGCRLVRRRERGNYRTLPNGRLTKQCSVCAEWYGIHRFYPRTLKRGEKVYFTFSSECRSCKSRKVSAYQRDKQQLKIK